MVFKHFAAAAAVAAALWAGMPTAWAIDVTPMVARIAPSGSGSTYRLSVRNTSATPVTVEIQLFKMEIAENGDRILTEEVNDLTVFPPQAVIPANREQVVQVRYVGDPRITGTSMYMVRAAQLPIDLATDQSQPVGATVKVAFNINTYAFVAPPGLEPAVSVTATRREANGDVVIAARNEGTGLAQLRQARYILTTADGQRLEVRGADVDVGQVGILPAGAARNVRIAKDLIPELNSDVSATIELL